MMNTKVYKAVHDLAEQLMEAANRNDRKRFELLFSRLKACLLYTSDAADE